MPAVYYAEGNHVAEVLSQELSASRNKGTPQLVLKVGILGVPNADGTYEKHKQQYERYVTLYLTEGTMPYVLEHLKTLGFTGTSLAQLNTDHPDHIDLAGNQVDLYCQHETYEGKERERWQISSQQSAAAVPLDAKKLRQLDALFGKGLREQAKAGGADQSKAFPPNKLSDGTEITDDDVPF